MMHGPPLELHVDPAAKPHVCHTPAPVPAHWDKQVRADLERDVALGVWERVEPNIGWFYKENTMETRGERPLNDACKRQTHHTAQPLQQALTIPHSTLKSTYDAWNGFHSLKLRAGMVLNPDKFQFTQETVDWAGIRVTMDK